MAVKTIRQYRTEQDGNTLIEFPIVDEENKNIIEVLVSCKLSIKK